VDAGHESEVVNPYYADDWLTVYLGDCREVMAAMEPESVHCVVTSPPYWGLRDYGIGEKGLGLEPTPELFVEAMVAVFREVRRVLRKDGTVWLNLGDSFGDKQLQGIPWRVAFALQADGWYLRSDIIWAKPNPMPESVTDRPTKAHEYVFLLSKSPRYYYDADAVREPAPFNTNRHMASGRLLAGNNHDAPTGLVGLGEPQLNRNLRSVWNIATEPYPGAHFATFPRALVEPCIKAGTSEKGVCPECGAAYERETAVEALEPTWARNGIAPELMANGTRTKDPTGAGGNTLVSGNRVTVSWAPLCLHEGDPVPATVLDPFAGSGTTGLVAQSLSRRAVLIDLSADYLEQLMDRNRDIPLGLAGG